MIDWINLAFNGLWIMGCSLALAVVTIIFGEQISGDQGFGMRIRKPHPQAFIHLAFVLIFVGQLGLTSMQWERLLWASLVIAFSAFTWSNLSNWQKAQEKNRKLTTSGVDINDQKIF